MVRQSLFYFQSKLKNKIKEEKQIFVLNHYDSGNCELKGNFFHYSIHWFLLISVITVVGERKGIKW